MDDQGRDHLLADLADAEGREALARRQLQAHAVKIDDVRAALGNPYFYSGRSADDPESAARFTGFASHEPAFTLVQELKQVRQRIANLRKQLQDEGI